MVLEANRELLRRNTSRASATNWYCFIASLGQSRRDHARKQPSAETPRHEAGGNTRSGLVPPGVTLVEPKRHATQVGRKGPTLSGENKKGRLAASSVIRQLPDGDAPSRGHDRGGSLPSLQHTAFLALARRFLCYWISSGKAAPASSSAATTKRRRELAEAM
jgi:hypothetical protein